MSNPLQMSNICLDDLQSKQIEKMTRRSCGTFPPINTHIDFEYLRFKNKCMYYKKHYFAFLVFSVLKFIKEDSNKVNFSIVSYSLNNHLSKSQINRIIVLMSCLK